MVLPVWVSAIVVTVPPLPGRGAQRSENSITRENMKPCEGEHETLPHEQSFARCLCYGGATHWSGREMHMHRKITNGKEK